MTLRVAMPESVCRPEAAQSRVILGVAIGAVLAACMAMHPAAKAADAIPAAAIPAAAIPAAANTPAANTPAANTPAVLLARIQQAARSLDYSGVFLYSQGEFTQASRVVHLVDGSGERERVEVLDGIPREYIRHNDDVQCLMPERKLIRLEKRRSDRFPGLLAGDPAALSDHYKITADAALRRVAGRECRMISIEPRDKLRYGYRLCADTQTNLLLKAQTLTPTHAIVEQVMFTALRVGTEVQAAQLTSRWNSRDWKVQQVAMTPVDLAAKGWRIPPPAGFVLTQEVGRTLGHGDSVSQVVFSDGLAAISLFVEPFDRKRNGHQPHGAVHRGAINAYGARVADFWLTAVGEVPIATLQQLAESIEYVPLASTK
jgi:sigma-E factor negative regulatory protein RseB